MIKIGICGLGFVGGAMHDSFGMKDNIHLVVYDKYKHGGIGEFDELLSTDILFLSLPTLYNEDIGEYDKRPIIETLGLLKDKEYNNLVVIKSTVEPGTCQKLADEYHLNIVHNPEFLTARQAFDDFHNQNHIVLGKTNQCSANKYDRLFNFYKSHYPEAQISKCTSTESESMKLFLNSFYAIKVQFFTEIFLSCNKMDMDFVKVRDLMLKNNWINPMHTCIPGPDGKISYGGMCFPKDTKALLAFMREKEVPCRVLEGVVEERDRMRDD